LEQKKQLQRIAGYKIYCSTEQHIERCAVMVLQIGAEKQNNSSLTKQTEEHRRNSGADLVFQLGKCVAGVPEAG